MIGTGSNSLAYELLAGIATIVESDTGGPEVLHALIGELERPALEGVALKLLILAAAGIKDTAERDGQTLAFGVDYMRRQDV